jgi:HEXXH motif-containing protein
VDGEGAATVRGDVRFLQGLRVVHPCGTAEVPIHDPGLSEPYHANAAIVRSARAVREWQGTLSRGIDLLAEFEPAVASELMALCPAVLPLHNGGISFGSASPEELVGLVYLPGVARVDDVAECLLHEAMHQKLYRIESCADLFQRDSPSGKVYYSPWRTDPRPLRMLLHGAYVFAGVAELWQKVWSAGGRREDHAERTLLRSRQCRQALEILERHGRFTPLGIRVMRGVREALKVIDGAVDVADATRAEIDARLAAHAERHAAYIC